MQLNTLSNTNAVTYLTQQGHNVLCLLSLDMIKASPYNTLYTELAKVNKPAFDNADRIVLFSTSKIEYPILKHLQQTTNELDISNFFVLLCAPDIDTIALDAVRTKFSTDDCCFSFLPMLIDSPVLNDHINPLVPLPDSFCYIPWAHLEILSDGEVRPCCVYQGGVTKADGTTYNINNDSISSVYHSDYLVSLRQQFRQGQRPNGCQHCWYQEDHGHSSHRQWSKVFLKQKLHSIDVDSDTTDNLVSLDIKLGNLCNLKCRICNPKSSSSVAAEQIKFLKSIGQDASVVRMLNKQGNWVDNNEIWTSLQSLGPNLVNLEFTGGEPLLIPQHEVFLDFLIERGYSSAIRLHYNTNGTVFSTALINKWKQFRHVDLAFSIDNVGHRFELERSGAKWSEINDNLNMYFSHKLNNMSLSVYPTVNIQNVLYLPELLDWYTSKPFDALHLSWLEHPDYMSINNLGPDLALLIAEQLEQSNHTDKLSGIIGILKNVSDNKLDKFVEHTAQLDQLREEKFSSTHVELSRLIDKVYKNV